MQMVTFEVDINNKYSTQARRPIASIKSNAYIGTRSMMQLSALSS
jgi:hypothetical protein